MEARLLGWKDYMTRNWEIGRWENMLEFKKEGPMASGDSLQPEKGYTDALIRQVNEAKEMAEKRLKIIQEVQRAVGVLPPGKPRGTSEVYEDPFLPPGMTDRAWPSSTEKAKEVNPRPNIFNIHEAPGGETWCVLRDLAQMLSVPIDNDDKIPSLFTKVRNAIRLVDELKRLHGEDTDFRNRLYGQAVEVAKLLGAESSAYGWEELFSQIRNAIQCMKESTPKRKIGFFRELDLASGIRKLAFDVLKLPATHMATSAEDLLALIAEEVARITHVNEALHKSLESERKTCEVEAHRLKQEKDHVQGDCDCMHKILKDVRSKLQEIVLVHCGVDFNSANAASPIALAEMIQGAFASGVLSGRKSESPAVTQETYLKEIERLRTQVQNMSAERTDLKLKLHEADCEIKEIFQHVESWTGFHPVSGEEVATLLKRSAEEKKGLLNSMSRDLQQVRSERDSFATLNQHLEGEVADLSASRQSLLKVLKGIGKSLGLDLTGGESSWVAEQTIGAISNLKNERDRVEYGLRQIVAEKLGTPIPEQSREWADILLSIDTALTRLTEESRSKEAGVEALGSPVTAADEELLKEHKQLVEKLEQVRKDHQGKESKEEACILDAMEATWWKMSAAGRDECRRQEEARGVHPVPAPWPAGMPQRNACSETTKDMAKSVGLPQPGEERPPV